MPTLQWALTCRRIITDSETNNVSYIDAIETLAASCFPVPLPPLWVATLWRRINADDALHARIRVQDPKGKTVLCFEPELPHPLPKARYRVNVLLAGLEIKETGEFSIIIEQKTEARWRREKSLPLDIALLPPPKPARKPAGRRRVLDHEP